MTVKIPMALIPLHEYIKNKYEYGGATPQKNTKINVEPSEIQFKLANRFYQDELPAHGTYVRGGSWDVREISQKTVYARKLDGERPKRGLIKIEDMPIYKSFKSHFLNGIEWENTEFYKLANEMHEKGVLIGTKYGPNRIDERLQHVDDLYSSIEREGYRETIGASRTNLIVVNIGRDGRFILGGDGLHRTILSIIIGIEQIPARIFVRHQKWQEKRYQVYKNQYKNEFPDNHPDINNVLVNSEQS